MTSNSFTWQLCEQIPITGLLSVQKGVSWVKLGGLEVGSRPWILSPPQSVRYAPFDLISRDSLNFSLIKQSKGQPSSCFRLLW